MLQFSQTQFDYSSFWLGIFIASMIWGLIITFWKLFPGIFTSIKNHINSIEQNTNAGIDSYLDLETAQYAQKHHLANQLFPLDDIAVTPRFLAPPLFVQPSGTYYPEALVTQVIPYLPDWPTLSSILKLPTISLAQALQNGGNIAIIGQAGCGKTTALAILAAQISRREPSIRAIFNKLPIFIHVIDLYYDKDFPDPIIPLHRGFSRKISFLVRPRILSIIRKKICDGKLILLIDGVDELSPPQLNMFCQYLKKLLNKYPKCQIVVTASTDYLDGLINLGFVPLSLTTWGIEEKKLLIKKWCTSWEKNYRSPSSKPGEQDVDARLLARWLDCDTTLTTPLEFTLRIWEVFSGDVTGKNINERIDSYFERITSRTSSNSTLEYFALEMFNQNTNFLKLSFTGKFAKKSKLVNGHLDHEKRKNVQKTESSIKVTRASLNNNQLLHGLKINNAINRMIKNQALVSHSGRKIRFSSPVFLGYFLSKSISDQSALFNHTSPWTPLLQAQHFQLLNLPQTALEHINYYLQQDDILLTNLLRYARSLPKMHAASEVKTKILRHLFTSLHDRKIATPVRYKVLCAFIQIKEASVQQVFRQIIKSPDPILRQMGAIGVASINDSKSHHHLLQLIKDDNSNVQITACLALVSMRIHRPDQFVLDIATKSNENLRRVVTEALASDVKLGHDVLKSLAESEDLMTRRAAVFGLAQIPRKWCVNLLEKISREDPQWVVRNAASQAFEALTKNDPRVPERPRSVYQSPWLIQYASKLGVGVTQDNPVVDFLTHALFSENYEDRLMSQYFLRLSPDSNTYKILISALRQANSFADEDAFIYTLWIYASSGKQLAG